MGLARNRLTFLEFSGATRRLVGGLGLLLASGPLAQAAAEWKQVYSQRLFDMRVFARDRPGFSVRELRAEGVLDLPATQVLAFLSDIGGQPGVLPPLESARLLRREGEQTFYHMVVAPRWASRRDYCIRVEVTSDEAGQGVTWTQEDATCPPPAKGVVRMRSNVGHWRVSAVTLPSGAPGARVVYQAHTDPGGAVPAWMVNRASPGNLFDTFTAIRKAAALPRYALK